ncbi:MAG: bifunctional riboflavin kinase/FAD synthetase [Microbacteriaceae bacterium]|nr:bifunctional riboflavin kinase/FAD synthetase [Microbacteriaceae bacterium]
MTEWPLPSDGVDSVITIGKFDGVHIGHHEVVSQLRARANGRRVVVVTFDRHPLELFDPARAPQPILSVPQKVEALLNAGADRVVVLPFTTEFAAMSPDAFIDDIVVTGLSASLVLVGSDFRFGAKGAGKIETLVARGATAGFEVVTLDHVCVDGETKVSSSTIREALRSGDVETATELLGRPHRVRGLVVHGHQRGRVLGYPTVNLEENNEGMIPRPGVYAGILRVHGQDFLAGISVGKNPTFTDVTRDQVEAHALDAEFDAYGSIAEVGFTHWIRDIEAFGSVDDLIAALHKDFADIRALIADGTIHL